MSSPFGKTPESHFSGLRRKDSKNALTTCHGVTDRGRACRRALSSPKNSSKFDGAIVITGNDGDPAVFFCWQHKDQAESANTDDGSVVELKGRHSLEEAFRSLGLEDVDEEPESPDAGIPEPRHTVATEYVTDSRPGNYSTPTRPSHHRSEKERESKSPPQSKARRRRTNTQSSRRNKPGFLSSLFKSCFTAEEPNRKYGHKDEVPRTARQRYEPVSPPRAEMKKTSRRHEHPSTGSPMEKTAHPRSEIPQAQRVRRKEVPAHRRSDSGIAVARKEVPMSRKPLDNDKPQRNRPGLQVYRDSVSEQPPSAPYLRPPFSASSSQPLSQHRPLNNRSKSTPDPQQLSLTHGEWPPPLPRNATDMTRIAYAKLLTAMSEAPTKSDSAGYIYIFWQTDVEATSDETSAVTSIISAPRLDRGLQRQETILQRRFFQTSANARLPRTPSEKRTLFLKIGRATNVHQRLTQWKKQCEYAVSLLRSYPYAPDSGAANKVPCVGKVERLIHLHLEMLGQRVKKECRCGTEHKEWFEVEASARGVRDVDEVVRRWVQWSEEKFGI
jgi:hypothetical protein